MRSSVDVVNPVDTVSALVGDTPLVEIAFRLDGVAGRVFAKYEAENMTGSVKDRMALHILRIGYASGALRPGMCIVEATSGNTGIAFAALGRALGHGVRIYMPDWMSAERRQLIARFGAEIVDVSRDEGGFVGAVQKANDAADADDDVFLPRQFDNTANVEAHALTTGPEIVRQLAMFERQADAFVAGVGTGGTVMGVGRALRAGGRSVRVHPLEPASSPTLRTGVRCGSHRIQGISDEFVPSILELDELDELVDVDDGDAILMAQAVCRERGLAVGISGGANLVGAIRLAAEMGPNATVVTILPDSNKKYLSTALCLDEPVESHYLTPRVEFDRVRAVR